MAKDKPNAPRPKPKVFFDKRSRDYFLEVRAQWRQMSSRDLKLFLRAMGWSDSWADDKIDNLKECEWIMKDAQENQAIDYAGPLAGYRAGVVEDSFGRKLLVTDEPQKLFDVLPKKCPAPKNFLAFIQALLPDHEGIHQWTLFAHWLAISLSSLRAGDFRPGQLVALAGKGGCGKSLLQFIVTEVLGGRVGSPFRYMMGETQFNYDLAGAEHWMIEDPPSSTDIRTRRLFGAKLKEATVNRVLNIHQKGKDAITLPTFRRVTLSVNDEPENLSVLPPLDDSILDKIFLFHCSPAQFGDKPADREHTQQLILAEVPAIRAWLLKGLPKLPAEFVSERFGVAAWHHPDLIRELCDMAPESRLWDMVCHALWSKPDDGDQVFEGKSIELENLLKQEFSNQEVERLLKNANSCGTYLSRLAKRYPDRITKRMKEGFIRWTILPPSKRES